MRREQFYERGHLSKQVADNRRQTQLRAGAATGADEYRKNKATFHAGPPARVRPPPTTLLPLVPAPGVGPPALPALAHAWPGRCPQRPTPAAGNALVAAGPQEGGAASNAMRAVLIQKLLQRGDARRGGG
jgi:hypothetical protein